MKHIFESIKTNPLFAGIALCDFERMLPCVEGRARTYRKGDLILLAGNPVHTIGVVASGSIKILREDAEGRKNLMAELTSGEAFGEVFACANISHSPVTVAAAEDCEILHLNYHKVIATCSAACPFHARLIENMLTLLAQKNLQLSKKIEILSKRTTRERLLLYFDVQRCGARQFTIPLNREELAAYLCVDRSAMSAELSRMQRDGLVRYHGNEIELLYDAI